MGYPDLPVFLGVGRYKGTWNANTNSGTLATGNWKDLQPLFASGSVGNRAPNNLGGYGANINLTATLGDFWKVTTAGSTPVDGEDTWRISDFIVFTYNSGSTSGSTWQKLSYTDTVSSIMYGNGSGGSTVFGLSAADVHEFTGSLYVSGALFAEELNTTSHNHTVITSIIEKSGSTRFGDSPGDLHQFSGSVYTGGNLAVSGTYAPHALTVHGEAGVAEYIRHLGDTNTHIRFEDDAVTLSAGGSRLIKLVEATQDEIILNDGLQDADLMHYPSSFIGAIPSIHISGSDGILHSNYGIIIHEGDLSGSGKIFNLGGIETAGALNVSGSTILGSANNDTHTFNGTVTSNDPVVMMDNMDVSGTLILHGPALRLTSSAQNADIYVAPLGRGLWMYNRSGGGDLDYNLVMYDNKVQVGAGSVPTHPLTVAGDMSGSGMLTAVGGVTTAGDANISGSAGVRGNVVCLGTVYTVDMSGSGKIRNVGGIETAGDLGVTGSATVRNMLTHLGDLSGSGKILNVGGIETQGDFGATGSLTVRGTSVINGNSRFASSAQIGYAAAASVTHPLMVSGDMSGSGKIFNLGGIETAGALNVSGSTIFGQKAADVHQFSGSVYVSGNVYAEQFHTTIHNQTVYSSTLHKSGSTEFGNTNDDTHTFIGTVIANDPARFLDDLDVSGSLTAHESIRITGTLGDYSWGIGGRMLRLLDTNASTFPYITLDNKTGIGNITPTHTLTVAGDLSGSGKIFNLGGIETAADLGVTGSVTAGNVMPRTDNTFDLGSASKRWANIYTGDLHLKNDRGDWTIVEEEDYLSVINNKTSKKYKMVLEEIED